MFKKSVLAKFEWEDKPEDLTDLFIENLIYEADYNNFAVVDFVADEKTDADVKGEANGEFWNTFVAMSHSPKYGIPKRIQVQNHRGMTFSTEEFVLFDNFSSWVNGYTDNITVNRRYARYYSEFISAINEALRTHVYASQLIATIYASSKEEKQEIEKLFKGFNGVKVIEYKDMLSEDNSKIIQFDITPRLAELESLKHELEKDAFLRLGIRYGTDKTHITDMNLKDSEEPLDLLNTYELKIREDFCERYNKFWASKGITRNLKVKLHEITKSNETEAVEENIENDNGGNEAVSDSGI